MSSWTNTPAPPGPLDNPDPTNEAWRPWVERKAQAIWRIALDGQEPDDWEFTIEIEEDGVFILPVSGDDPIAWEATKSKRTGSISFNFVRP